jgi:hypothetical protein
MSGPVIRLCNLSPEDLYVLLHNIRHVFALGDQSKYLVPDEAIKAFMVRCSKVLGADFFSTPRDAVKSFVGFLSVLEQNPSLGWQALLKQTHPEATPAVEPVANADDTDSTQTEAKAESDPPPKAQDGDELATFKI